MERYVAARPDIFFTGRDGSLRSNRTYCQMAGLYATDLFIGSTLQMDAERQFVDRDARAHRRLRRRAEHGQRSARPPACERRLARAARRSRRIGARGRKLVVQLVQSFRDGMAPTFVETLDAVEVGKTAGLPLAARDDLRRRRHPCRHRGRHRLPVSGERCRRTPRRARRDRGRHAARHGELGRTRSRNCAGAASSRFPKISACVASKRSARCSPRATCARSSNGRAVCTSRLRDSGAGDE